MLTGWKTYIAAALLALESVAEAKGWITPDQAGWIKTLLGAGGLAALRLAIANAQAK